MTTARSFVISMGPRLFRYHEKDKKEAIWPMQTGCAQHGFHTILRPLSYGYDQLLEEVRVVTGRTRNILMACDPYARVHNTVTWCSVKSNLNLASDRSSFSRTTTTTSSSHIGLTGSSLYLHYSCGLNSAMLSSTVPPWRRHHPHLKTSSHLSRRSIPTY